MKYIFLSIIGIFSFAAMASAAEVEGVDPASPVNEAIGFRLPDGFKASVFADNLGRARHAIVRPDGVLYVARRTNPAGTDGGIVALKDGDGDGVADVIDSFSENLNGTGIGFHNGFLYYSSTTRLYRAAFENDELVPSGQRQLMITFPAQGQHASKPFTFDGEGNIYVNVGAPSNNCQVRSRSRGSPGQQPCPQLNHQAGIYRFPAEKTGQDHLRDAHRYASGIRNAMGLDWNFDAEALFFTQHGRDQLSELWPQFYTAEQRALLPAEEFHRAADGSSHGWPYSYWDQIKGRRMVSPEYGGDGETFAEGEYSDPIAAFPGHWAPNDLVIYGGDAFPEGFKGGAFIAFHGSWNRAPFPQAGYKVVFVPFSEGKPAGAPIVFADGFPGRERISSPGQARFRPMGLAVAPDGALFITDSAKGRVWRVTYEGGGG